jgi:hypothetical protein
MLQGLDFAAPGAPLNTFTISLNVAAHATWRLKPSFYYNYKLQQNLRVV